MKILINIFFLFIFSFSFALETDKWAIKKDIIITSKLSYQNFLLDQEVYKYTINDLGDLRIFDSKGDVVPYYINRNFEEINKKELLNKAHKIGKYLDKSSSFIEFKAYIPDENIDIYTNIIQFELPNYDFHKNISVYGSYDNLKWDYITNGTLYTVLGLRKDELKLPINYKYKYYKIEIPNNTENIDFSSVNLIYRKEDKNLYSYSKKYNSQFIKTEKDKNTIITIKNDSYLNIKNINLTINSNYKRKYTLFGIRKDTNEKVYINSGSIYQMNFEENIIKNNYISPSKNTSVFSELIIEIVNGDNKALEFKNIEFEYRVDQVVFELKKDEKYTLFIGNINAQKPSYDIDFFKKQINMEKQNEASLSKAVLLNPNTKLGNIPYKLIYNIVIVIVTLIFLLIMIFSLKRKIN